MFKFVISVSLCSTGFNLRTITLLLFLIYINDLPDGLESSVKLFADDTSLFSTAYDSNMLDDQLDKDLNKIQIGHTNGK